VRPTRSESFPPTARFSRPIEAIRPRGLKIGKSTVTSRNRMIASSAGGFRTHSIHCLAPIVGFRNSLASRRSHDENWYNDRREYQKGRLVGNTRLRVMGSKGAKERHSRIGSSLDRPRAARRTAKRVYWLRRRAGLKVPRKCLVRDEHMPTQSRPKPWSMEPGACCQLRRLPVRTVLLCRGAASVIGPWPLNVTMPSITRMSMLSLSMWLEPSHIAAPPQPNGNCRPGSCRLPNWCS